MPPGSGEMFERGSAVGRLGGVRADFVANLGRRLSELREHFAELEQEPNLERPRDEVRRRVHALATRARLLEFGVMAENLDEAQRRLDHAAVSGGLGPNDVDWFHELFRSLPSHAWNAVADDKQQLSIPSYEPAPEPRASTRAAQPTVYPIAVLVVSREKLAASLQAGGIDSPEMQAEWEHTDNVSAAPDLARALAPDVIVVDADLPGSRELVIALASDPLTELVPVVAVGSWKVTEGVSDLPSAVISRAVAKPASPDRVRQAILEALRSGPRSQPAIEIVGELTVEELSNRLATQIRAGLVDAVHPQLRDTRVQFGEGAELLAAIWGAIARIRETLTIRSQGKLRFSSEGPAGSVPMVPWLPEEPGTSAPRRLSERDDQSPARLRLHGRRVLVTDDDPAVTWFLSGLLRAAGALVHEAHDGRKALELAYRFAPDLVISDILMPGLDGFALCRELKRDVVLHDVPVILLSWKEDLLQRVRELGADADGYLKKESSGATVLRRVHEVLRPRLRVESRLKSGEEVRGRLDGLAAWTLLRLVMTSQPDARLAVRDATFLFEVEIRNGIPRSATRTTFDGAFERGHGPLAALLGVLSGRFRVVPANNPVRDSLQGDWVSLVNLAVARARAAQSLLSGARLFGTKSITISAEALILDAVPEPARGWLVSLARGTSPERLIAEQHVSPALLELLLDDAARRGGILAVVDRSGRDRLAEETQRMVEIMRVDETLLRRVQRKTQEALVDATPTPARLELPIQDEAVLPAAGPDGPFISFRPTSRESLDSMEERSGGAVGSGGSAWVESQDLFSLPTSLTEAVIREVSDVGGGKFMAEDSAMMDAAALKPRTAQAVVPVIPSVPPDAVVPAAEASASESVHPAAEPAVPAGPSIPPMGVIGFETVKDATSGVTSAGKPGRLSNETAETQPRPEAAQSSEKTSRALPDDRRREAERVDGSAQARAAAEIRATSTRELIEPGRQIAVSARGAQSAPTTRHAKIEAEKPRRAQRSWGVSTTAAFLGLGLAIGLVAVRLFGLFNPAQPLPNTSPSVRVVPVRSDTEVAVASGPTQTGSGVPVATLPASSMASTAAPAPSESAPVRIDDEEADLPLPPGSRMPKGAGLLEVRTALADATVSADGREIGAGVVVYAVLKPGEHSVQMRWRGREVQRDVIIRPNRRTRWNPAQP